MTPTATAPEYLAHAVWQSRAAAYGIKARRYTSAARKRRDCGEPHPIEDFLFTYYSFSFGKLETWHPGAGVALEWPEETLRGAFDERHYRIIGGVCFADPSLLATKERERLRWIRELLENTRDRAPNFACHGLHEWAMVYRGQEVRHEKTTTLRLPQAEIDAVIESRPICCSHFDAFRFFAKEARPLNRLQLSLDSRLDHEQPACIHANMDLYKWAGKAMPWIGSELWLETFELAVELRDLDMRASPYDLSAWGREAVRIETADGRREYEQAQRMLAAKAAVVRQRLIDALASVA